MKKLKKLFNKMSENYKEYVKTYLFTNIGLILFTLYLMVFDTEGIDVDLFSRIFVLFICSNFLIESTFKVQDKKRVYLYLLSFALAIIIGIILPINNRIAINMYLGYNLICILVGLFFITRKEKKPSEYLCKVFYNLFKVELFTGVLLVGFGIIYIIIDSLIVEGYDVDFYSKIFYFIIGIYNIPFSIMSLIYTKEDIPEVVNTLIKRVLLVLLDVSYVVIIIYILKIVITGVIPANEVFIVVTMLFAFSLPMFIMLSNYKGKIVEFNYKYLPYVLLAPILLQVYSMIVRVNTYGFTTSRYFGVYVIIFELVSIFLLQFKNKKLLKYDFLVMAFMSLILFVLPITNLYEAPIELQVMRLQSIWKENTDEYKLTRAERQRIKDIYEYLNEYDEADKYMPSYLNMERVNKYLMNTRGEYDDIQANYFAFVAKDEQIDISEYKTLETVTYQGGKMLLDDINIKIGTTEFFIKDNLVEFMKNQEIDHMVFDNGNDAVFYVKEMDFYYNDSDTSIENYLIVGYVLYRK